MTANTTALLALLLLPGLVSPAGADETPAQFKGLSYPLEMALPVPEKDGDVLFETPYSEAPDADYDTVLLQGVMPDPGVTIELTVKGRSFFAPAARHPYETLRRFPDGRFWASFSVPATRQPLKLRVLSSGSKLPSSLTVYESDLFIAGKEQEVPVEGSTVPYVIPDDLFYPASGPFTLIRRAEWQAAPPKEPYTPHTPRAFTLHHTQGNYPQSVEAALREVQFIQDYHQNAKKWIDIGYHFLIDPLGNVYEGRPIKVLGAHVANKNTGNVGISVLGNYHPPKRDVFTDRSRDAFVAVAGYVKNTYDVQVSSFFAHRELGITDCPGDDLYARKGELASLIFAPPAPQDVPAPPAGERPPLTPAQEQSLRQLKLFLNLR
ncbi:MAG: peptidoglycan recognition protein family protein [Elusimicrobiales bacterium]